MRQAKDILKDLLPFIGTAHCSGWKCRLPHCDCCKDEDDAQEAHDEMCSLKIEAEKLINGRLN